MAKIPKGGSVKFTELLLEVCRERGWDMVQAQASLARSIIMVPSCRKLAVPLAKAQMCKRAIAGMLDELDKTPKEAIQAELDAYNSRN